MKYDIELDPAQANTSHNQILELVGTGKRVLDVGCSTGYLAKALKERGNEVTGVEVDPQAAEVARPHLARLLVGDLAQLDLVAELGEGAYDVIVFADVLEHLTEPVAVLRQAPRLLDTGGFVVASIPNIGHGAVRLALLQGRFEYRPLGLLDETHVRFFTRRSVDDLHRAAGLRPVEYRRTVADPLATEIPVDAADFPPELVERLSRDSEATTYQFVVRSVPATGAGDEGAELVQRDQELAEAQAALHAVQRAVRRTRPPVVGVIQHEPTPTDRAGAVAELRATVLRSELTRRLPGSELRAFSVADPARPDADGQAVAPLLADGSPVASGLEAAVFLGPWNPSTSRAVADLSEQGGFPVHVVGTHPTTPGDVSTARQPSAAVGWDGADRHRSLPDLLLLVHRLYPPPLIDAEAAFLRAVGHLPATSSSGHLLVSAVGEAPAALAHGLDAVCSDGDLPVAIVPDPHADPAGELAAELAGALTTPSTILPPELGALGLVAAVTTARLVVARDPVLLWLAAGLHRPFLGLGSPDGPLQAIRSWLDDPDLCVPSPGPMAQRVDLADRRAKDASALAGAADELELFLDDLGHAVASAVATRVATTLPELVAEAEARATALEGVCDGLRHQLRKLRLAAGQVAMGAAPGSAADGHAGQELRQRAEAAEAEVARLRAEMEATNATLTMRVLAPARRAYGRLRRLR